MEQHTNQQTNKPTNQQTNKPTNQQTNKPADERARVFFSNESESETREAKKIRFKRDFLFFFLPRFVAHASVEAPAE
jgi:type III secretory pathway component EscR